MADGCAGGHALSEVRGSNIHAEKPVGSTGMLKCALVEDTCKEAMTHSDVDDMSMLDSHGDVESTIANDEDPRGWKTVRAKTKKPWRRKPKQNIAAAQKQAQNPGKAKQKEAIGTKCQGLGDNRCSVLGDQTTSQR